MHSANRIKTKLRRVHVSERCATVSQQVTLYSLQGHFFFLQNVSTLIQFPKIFEIFRRGKPTLNHFLRKPAYVGTLFYT